MAVGDILRAAAAAHEGIESFEATQTVAAGPIRCEARILWQRPDRIAVDYLKYEDPLAALEDRLSGAIELAPDELVGLHIVTEGEGTWLYDARTSLALRKPGRALFAPLAPVSLLGELGYVPTLVRDFLVRDEGEALVQGRVAYRLGLRPKTPYRSLLLKEEAFPLREATLHLDKETLFPLRLAVRPSPEARLALLIDPKTGIEVEYRGVRLNEIKEKAFEFTPPEGVRVFREERARAEELEEGLPFSLSLERAAKMGYGVVGEKAVLTRSDAKDRAYVAFTLAPRAQGDEAPDAAVLIRVGNYLSRNMARRRSLLAEKGEPVSLGGVSGRLLDRAELAKENLPEALDRELLEVSWEREGVFWFLLGEGLDRTAVLGLAGVLAEQAA